MPWKGRYPQAEGGASRPRSLEHGARRAARTRRRPIGEDEVHGRMDWRVEGPRQRTDRSLSACRSLPIQQVRYGERGLWGAITLLSLFAGAVTATPQPWHHNQTLGAVSYGSVGMVIPTPVEENIQEAPSLAAWNHWHGDNMTVQGLSAADLLRAKRSRATSSKARKGSRKAGRGSRNCRPHKLMVKVRDLGLGYKSDEIVPFKYCSGSCQSVLTNYDMILSSLLRQRAIIPEPHNRPASHPCCRPTRYEDISFMDVTNAWQTVENISAAECSCVG